MTQDRGVNAAAAISSVGASSGAKAEHHRFTAGTAVSPFNGRSTCAPILPQQVTT